MEKKDSKYHLTRDYFTKPKRVGPYSLYQIGRSYCQSGAHVEQHSHLDFFEFTVVTGGAGTVITNEIACPVHSGDIYVSFPGDFHEIYSDELRPLRYDFLALSCRERELAPELERIMSMFYDAGVRVIRDENITSLVAMTLAEVNGEVKHTEKVLEAIFTQIFCYMVRSFHSASPIHYAKGTGEDEMLCYQVMTYIDSHIYTMRTLTEVADALNYNYNYLSNLFKKVTGDTVSDYYRNRRLETARLLLLERRMGVTRVAQMLGYSSVYTFSRAFKEMFSVAPSRARSEGAALRARKRRLARMEISSAEQEIRSFTDLAAAEI